MTQQPPPPPHPDPVTRQPAPPPPSDDASDAGRVAKPGTYPAPAVRDRPPVLPRPGAAEQAASDTDAAPSPPSASPPPAPAATPWRWSSPAGAPAAGARATGAPAAEAPTAGLPAAGSPTAGSPPAASPTPTSASSSPPPASSSPSADGGEVGPPPPPAVPGSDRESRASAATWVAGVGALLLLAAAATFLAVSWDAIGLTARVAIVAAATGSAILGGHRLRRTLPAVGAVLFHLGALLVPIDALGLAFQLDVSVGARWLAVGATATLVLPVLAAAGRSTVLGWGAAAGVPVLATGAGLLGVELAGAAAAPAFVAGAALLAAVASSGTIAMREGVQRQLSASAWVLAVVAVYAPIVIAALHDIVPSRGRVLNQLVAAGWPPAVWWTVLLSGAVAVVAIALVATRRRSRGLVALAIASAAVAALSAMIATTAPDGLVTVLPAVVVVAVQLLALTLREDDLWAVPARAIAVVVEAATIIATGPLVVATLFHRYDDTFTFDVPLATAALLLALAWGVAAVRRIDDRGLRSPLVPPLVGLAALSLVSAAVVAGLPIWVASLLSAAAVAAAAWWRMPAVGEAPARDAGLTAFVTAVVLALAGLAITGVEPWVVGLLVAVVLAAGLHVRSTGTRPQDGVVTSVLLLAVPGAVAAILTAAVLIELLVEGWGAVVAIVALFVTAALADTRPVFADVLRGIAVTVGLVSTSRLLGTDLPVASGTAAEVIDGFALGLPALLPAGLAAVWGIVDAVRSRRAVLAAIVVPVAVRVVASAALVAGVSPTVTGIVLLVVAVAAALAAVVGVGRWLPVPIVVAVVAGGLGIPLAGMGRELVSSLIVAAGLIVAGAGAVRSKPVVAHVGGAVAILGTWDLLGYTGIDSLDLWTLPLALHLWAAGIVARRRDGTSSWIADVPPLLLVAVPALVERATGGGGWHAVLAGGLAVAAVILGGSERLGGPLVVGTGVLVAVVLVETFAVVAAVPTWAWLAVGGLTLVGAAAAMEKAGGSPVTAARRLVDVIQERFD